MGWLAKILCASVPISRLLTVIGCLFRIIKVKALEAGFNLEKDLAVAFYGLLRDYTTLGCTKVGTFLMFPTAQLGCKCIKPLPGSNNTQTFHIRTIWTD